MTAKEIIVHGHSGLGDNIYQVPAVQAISARNPGAVVWVGTPWPEVYAGLDHILTFPKTVNLRAQNHNIGRQPAWWRSRGGRVPRRSADYRFSYGAAASRGAGTIVEVLREQAGGRPKPYVLSLDHAPLLAWFERARKRHRVGNRDYILVRPPSVRKEWPAPGRNPRLGDFVHALKALRGIFRGKRFVFVGWNSYLEEEVATVPHRAQDLKLLRGEATTEDLIGLAAGAYAILGTQSFVVPLGMAVDVPTVVVFGGYAPPTALMDEAERPHFLNLTPKEPCWCWDIRHPCSVYHDRNLMTERIEQWASTLPF